jgi:hypothetical protein
MKETKPNYISLQEATKYCNYSQEYLSLRARKGKLKTIKIGRNWVTKKEWLEEYLKKTELNYISLQAATKYCNYSQEYLSLRARKGKLKTIKIGRNWVTKKEWLEEYLKKVEEYNNFKTKKVVSPPENLPTEVVSARPPLVKPVPQIQFVYVVALVFVLLVAGGIFVLRQARGDLEFAEWTSRVSYPHTDIATIATISVPRVLKEAEGTFKRFGQWIVEIYTVANNFVEEKIAQGYKAFTQFWKAPEEGLVVIPSTEKDEEVKKKIKEAFSDEVKVEPKDKTSGIIIPIFREREGQKYLYILVPVQNEN